jgi:hypothetical protein
MIQIDGLSRKQFENACHANKMPFIKSLVRDHSIGSFYSGLPSSTPAVQAELFYGIRCAVPSFGFRDRKSCKRTSMLVFDTAKAVEQELEQADPGLFNGGCTYADNYTGGAKKSRFCITCLGASDFIKKGFPHFVKAMILHLFIIIRVSILLLIELVLSLFDLIRGVIKSESFFSELRFIPARVGICVIMRELIVASICQDIKNGESTIHCNFLGYDEQSHRRGPSSRFAHWTLRGIDDAIRRIFLFSKKHNTYSLWIYSDHGQEHAVAYQNLYKQSLHHAINDVLSFLPVTETSSIYVNQGIQTQRAALLNKKILTTLASIHNDKNIATVVATGPIGHVYVNRPLSSEEKTDIALLLVKKANIPTVAVVLPDQKVKAFTSRGVFELPEKTVAIVGANHPFIDALKDDLVLLIKHPYSGDFVLFGWRPDDPPVTFPIENGAHAGPGREETHGFTFLPNSVNLRINKKHYLRPHDLRKAVLEYLG